MGKRLSLLQIAIAAAFLLNAAAHFHSHSNEHGSPYRRIGQKYGMSSCAFAPTLNHHRLPSSLLFHQPSNSQSSGSPCVTPPIIPHLRSVKTPPLFMSAPPSTKSNEAPNSAVQASTPEYPLVVVVGGSGFLGSEIRRQLQERGVRYIATSTKGGGEEKFAPIDLTAADAEEQFYSLIANSEAEKVAVISAMGTIGTSEDEGVNSALARAIKGAHRANIEDNVGSDDDDQKVGVERFVMIGNTDRVRKLARNVPFLKGYASGKDEAESALKECFGNQGCIIKPSFIYGGDEFSLQPPRVPTNLGSIASEVLGLYPFQALADKLHNTLAVPLAPPDSVEIVAATAVNVALGIVEGYTEELEGEAIKMAGSVRGWKEKIRYNKWVKEELEGWESGIVYDGSGKEAHSIAVMEIDEERRWKRIADLKEKLLRGGSPSVGYGDDIDDAIANMEELECLRPQSMKPAYDPKLNGQWHFVLSKDDLGTSLIKELLPPEYFFGDDDSATTSTSTPPWKVLLNNLYQLKGLYMKIYDEQSKIDIVLSSNILFGKVPIDIVISTSLISTNYGEETNGILLLEKFESIEVGGISLPVPYSWQRFRYLEITYLDDEIVIARGSGEEPHVLFRAPTKCSFQA
ncbi:hypothetical protein ACHAXR_012361 [Thalassiosira sp. AJA248-18]